MKKTNQETIKKILAIEPDFSSHLDSDFGLAIVDAEKCLPDYMHNWLSDAVPKIMKLSCRDYRGFCKALGDQARNSGYIRSQDVGPMFDISCLYYGEIELEVNMLLANRVTLLRDVTAKYTQQIAL